MSGLYPIRIQRLVGFCGLVAAMIVLGTVTAPAAAAEGYVLGADRLGAIKDSYIVVLKDDVSRRGESARTANALTERYGGQVRTSWQDALNGFAATMTDGQARRLASDPRVAYVEQDAVVHLATTQLNPPSWGLDRVDQRSLPLNSRYNYFATASNVHAYVIDTGIRTTHSTFGGRASWGFNAVDSNNTDCNGHGTHVAGTIGGAQYGIAKGIALVAVKVLNCSRTGSAAQVISGVNWVTAHAIKPAVANMSLGLPGPGSNPAVDAAVRGSIQSGITYAVAAGNDNGANACLGTPSKVAEAITVGSTEINDSRSSFSNIGTCLDLFAPGGNITSSWNTSDTAINSISGTSMATPHATAAAALYLSTHPGATPATVQSALIAQATSGKVTNPGAGSPNRLLYTGVAVANPGNRSYLNTDAVRLQLTAFGGVAPYTWSATGLTNSGMALSPSAGIISGLFPVPGNYIVTVTATATTGGSDSTTFRIHIGRECGGC